MNIGRLVQIRKAINLNNAHLGDYEEYQQLLIESGKFTQQDILNKLADFGYGGWREYYLSRRAAKYGEPRPTEGAVLGSILGMSTSVIVMCKLDEVIKKIQNT